MRMHASPSLQSAHAGKSSAMRVNMAGLVTALLALSATLPQHTQAGACLSSGSIDET
jgi:hypothetical protein